VGKIGCSEKTKSLSTGPLPDYRGGGGDTKYFGLFRNSQHKLGLLCEFGGFHSNALRIPFARRMKLRRWIVGPEVWNERSSFGTLGSDFPVAQSHNRDEAALLC